MLEEAPGSGCRAKRAPWRRGHLGWVLKDMFAGYRERAVQWAEQL